MEASTSVCPQFMTVECVKETSQGGYELNNPQCILKKDDSVEFRYDTRQNLSYSVLMPVKEVRNDGLNHQNCPMRSNIAVINNGEQVNIHKQTPYLTASQIHHKEILPNVSEMKEHGRHEDDEVQVLQVVRPTHQQQSDQLVIVQVAPYAFIVTKPPEGTHPTVAEVVQLETMDSRTDVLKENSETGPVVTGMVQVNTIANLQVTNNDVVHMKQNQPNGELVKEANPQIGIQTAVLAGYKTIAPNVAGPTMLQLHSYHTANNQNNQVEPPKVSEATVIPNSNSHVQSVQANNVQTNNVQTNQQSVDKQEGPFPVALLATFVNNSHRDHIQVNEQNWHQRDASHVGPISSVPMYHQPTPPTKQFKNREPKKRVASVGRDTKPAECDICRFSFLSRGGLILHLRRMHPGELNPAQGAERLKCTVCEKQFYVEEHLKQHIGAFHNESMTVGCHLCKRNFLDVGGLVAHVKLYHPETSQVCTKQWCVGNTPQQHQT